MLLMAFWSRCHKVSSTGKQRQFPWEPGNPTILQWLVIWFLTRKEIIPSVKFIKDKGKSAALFENPSRNWIPAFDNGFSKEEMALVECWKNSKSQPVAESREWIESVVELTQQMFEFYSK